MEGVEKVINNDNKYNIINMIHADSKSNASDKRSSRTRLFLKVQDGCDHSCSYCVIPMARGRSRSVSVEKLIEKINTSVDQGYREAVLTGIHIGLYGDDIDSSLNELIERILASTSIERIRLSSLEIREIDDRLLDLMRDGRVCNHLHVPLQSGDDRILELMNRPYNSSFFKDKIERIISRLGDMALGTDVITGFPHEGEGEFANTMEMLEELPFTYIHVFPYSNRPGTAASTLKGQIGGTEMKRRASILRGISRKKKAEFLNRNVGCTLRVLIEDSISENEYRGTSGNYLKVHAFSDGLERGSIVPVRIEGSREGFLFGKPIINL
jgi:threonylcarbamoyladenosine tRNA methylthiotransferase MtaB